MLVRDTQGTAACGRAAEPDPSSTKARHYFEPNWEDAMVGERRPERERRQERERTWPGRRSRRGKDACVGYEAVASVGVAPGVAGRGRVRPAKELAVIGNESVERGLEASVREGRASIVFSHR